jgi:hypothetical protein
MFAFFFLSAPGLKESVWFGCCPSRLQNDLDPEILDPSS